MDLRNNKISKMFRTNAFRIISVMCVSLLTLNGCARFDEEDHYPLSGNGRTHAKLSLDLMAPSANVVTRGVDMSESAQVKIESLWIGIFDTKTGEQVGRLAGHVRKASGDRITFGSGTHTINDIDIYYYDSNPEVYIVGVANYHNSGKHVMAHKAGEKDEFVELYKLLGIDEATVGAELSDFAETITWDDFRNISIDTESADLALDKDGYCPILMGFFNSSRGVITSTVNGDGVVSDGRIRLVGTENTSDAIELSGCINFKRLVSEFQVSVRGKEYSEEDRYKTKISNVQYKVVNMPLEVYLAEHATYNKSAEAGKGTYLKHTPNSADVAVINKTGAGYTDSGDWQLAEGNSEDGYYFSFQQYENKHWGIDYDYGHKVFRTPDWEYGAYEGSNNFQVMSIGSYDGVGDLTWKQYLSYWGSGPINRYLSNPSFQGPNRNPWFYMSLVAERNAHSIREAKWENSNILKSLVKDRQHSADYNNHASYIMIKADIEEWEYNTVKSRASVEYTIHEGYTSNINGTVVDTDYTKAENTDAVSNRILDFQCIRNTQYIYNIRINGADDLYMQASSSGPYAHNDGLTGNYTSPVYIQKVWSGGGNGSSGSYDMDDFPALYHKATSNATPAVRFYEKRPVVNGDGEIIGYETFNYGNTTIDSDYAEWPPIEGEMLSLDKLPDDLKDFVLVYILDGNRTTGLGGSQGYKDRHDATPPYFKDELGFEMTLVDFLENWDPADNPYSSTDYYIYVNGYTAPSDVAYKAYDEYHRGVYFVMDVVDDDGCTVNMMQGFEQDGLYDTRSSCPSVTEFFNHNIQYSSNWDSYSYYNNFFLENWTYVYYWSTGLGVVSDDRIEWQRVTATYYTDPNDRFSSTRETVTKYKLQMYDYDKNADDFNIKEDLYYIVDIEGKHKDNVTTYPWYNNGNPNYPIISLPTKELIEELGLSAGVYGLAVMPLADERYVQPCKPSRDDIYRLIVHEPKWTFDDELLYSGELHSGASDGPNETMTFGGLTMIGGGSSINDLFRIDTENGYVNLGGRGTFNPKFYSGSVDYRIIKFNLDQPAEVIVTVSNSGNTSRPLCFAARNNGDDYSNGWANEVSEIIPSNHYGRRVVFDTCEVTADFEDDYLFTDESGNKYLEFAIYSGDSGLRIEEIEIKPYTGKKESLSTSSFWYNRTPFYIGDDYYYLHNKEIYMQNGSSAVWHMFVKGLTTYFAFEDSDPRASAYRLELYRNLNDANPVFSTTVSSEDCKNSALLYDRSFIIPVMMPSDATITPGEYILKLTAIGDGETYLSGRPRTLTYNGTRDEEKTVLVFDLDQTTDWLSDSNYYNRNPFFSNVAGSPNDYFPDNAVGHYFEYKGLVLHSGNRSANITLGENSITFGGSGYPINNINTGRYMSFTTDRPIDVVITAQGGKGSNPVDRAFRLYNVSKSVAKDEYIDRQVFSSDARETYTLSTGVVNGPTEFIICPEEGITLYSIQLKPAEDTRQSLVEEGSIAYSNYSSAPNFDSHPYWYGIWTNPFYAARYFTSYISFSDALGRAETYLFEVCNDLEEVLYSTTVDSSMLAYEDDGKKVFTVPMWTADLEGPKNMYNPTESDYTIRVTPKGDGEIYKPASPQFISKLRIYDWADKSYYPPREEYPEIPDYAWSTIMDWGFDMLAEEYLSDVPAQVVSIGKGQFMEAYGLKINGSGNNGTRLLRADDRKGVQGEDFYIWLDFGGQGYPYIGRTNDTNVGTGRNISITTNKTGKFIILARSGSTDTNKHLLLYDSKSVANPIASAQVIYNNSYDAASIVEDSKWMSLETGEVAQPTEFLICSDSNVQILAVMFIPKDDTLYEWDWGNGAPQYSGASQTRSVRGRSPQRSKWLTTFGSQMRQALDKH